MAEVCPKCGTRISCEFINEEGDYILTCPSLDCDWRIQSHGKNHPDEQMECENCRGVFQKKDLQDNAGLGGCPYCNSLYVRKK
jgi:hypothetical protein